jgi:hypothetical protein
MLALLGTLSSEGRHGYKVDVEDERGVGKLCGL